MTSNEDYKIKQCNKLNIMQENRKDDKQIKMQEDAIIRMLMTGFCLLFSFFLMMNKLTMKFIQLRNLFNDIFF